MLDVQLCTIAETKADRKGALMIQFAIVSLLVLLLIPSNASAQSCVGNPVAVQILGSGGPRVNPDRASSSYVRWIGAQAKILVDMGGGAFLRFGQAQSKLSDLSLVAISHLHPDHVSDLPALLWLSHQARKDPLPIAGPSGNEVAPSFSTFLSRLFDEKTGAFQVLVPRWVPRRAREGEAFVSTSESLT